MRSASERGVHNFDRSTILTEPCPAPPGGEFVVTMTPPRDVLREQLRVILYYRFGDKLWVVSHSDVRLSQLMAATCEQEVLGAALKRAPPRLSAIVCVLACIVLAALSLAFSCPGRGLR